MNTIRNDMKNNRNEYDYNKKLNNIQVLPGSD